MNNQIKNIESTEKWRKENVYNTIISVTLTIFLVKCV